MVLTVLLRKFQKSQECSSFRFSKVTCVFQLRISKKPRVCFSFEFPKATGVFQLQITKSHRCVSAVSASNFQKPQVCFSFEFPKATGLFQLRISKSHRCVSALNFLPITILNLAERMILHKKLLGSNVCWCSSLGLNLAVLTRIDHHRKL